MTRVGIIPLAFVITSLAVPAGLLPADEPATRPGRLALLMDALRDAEKPGDAAGAYARANAISPDSLLLHELYMRRMLTFGLPQIAVHPARRLIGLGADSGLAYAVVGYNHGQEEELPDAFSATLRAAELIPDNPGVLNNAGQLVGWYESQVNPPKVSAASRRILDAKRGQLMEQKEFRDAYERVTGAYGRVSDALTDLDERIEDARAELRNAQAVALELDEQLRAINDEIDDHERAIDDLRRELIYVYVRPRVYYDEDDYYRRRYYRRPRTGRLRDEIHDLIDEHEDAIDDLEDEAAAIRRRGGPVLARLERQRGRLDELTAEREQVLEGFQRHFRWDPPAVDGEITPQRENVNLSPGRRIELPENPEAEAARRLQLARLYLRNDLFERALEILDEVIHRYGDTKAGREARALLKSLSEPAEGDKPTSDGDRSD